MRIFSIIVLTLLITVAHVRSVSDVAPSSMSGPNELHVTDGSYVMSVGELQINITNFGLVGSLHSIQSSYSDAPSAQWPAGSGDEYLFGAGLWIGGIMHGEKRVSTGVFEMELRAPPEPEATIYESLNGEIIRPWRNTVAGGRRFHEGGGDDDGDGLVDEEILDGYDEDGDGLIDEDYAHLGNQMMVCTMIDDSRVAAELYPDHEPLHVDVVQTAIAWANDDLDDAVCLTYEVTNHGAETIENLTMGFFADFDIGNRLRAEAPFDDTAGTWSGVVESSSGTWVQVSVAYMADASSRDPVPGYVGIVFLGHSGSRSLATFRRYTGLMPFILGGDPTNDAERFEALRPGIDANVADGLEGDYRILCSPGGLGNLRPGASASLELAVVIGDGLDNLLMNCANILETRRGQNLDLDDNPWTGILGRETKICLEDYDPLPFEGTPLPYMVAAYVDDSCRPEDFDYIVELDLVEEWDGRHCIWVNMDNCDECRDIKGSPCTESDFFSRWNCNRWDLPLVSLRGCTGVLGREAYADWLGPTNPDPPSMRVWERSNMVHVYWSDISERSIDPISGRVDFEGYQIWRADDWDRPYGASEDMGPRSELWQMLGAYDVENVYQRVRRLGGRVIVDTLPLGDNTGLEVIRYQPSCLSAGRFAGLAEIMDRVVEELDRLPGHLPPLYDANGLPVPGLAALLPWKSYPTELDTFYMVTGRPDAAGRPGKDALSFYEYIDPDVHNGFLYFYAVSTSDHVVNEFWDSDFTMGAGLTGDPAVNFTTAMPTVDAQTADDRRERGQRVFVYPNPATREALADFQQMHPTGDDPTGVRVMFANLPAERSTIQVFSLNGDLVAEIDHDGTDGRGETSWNLVSRNGQQVVSGIYIYRVQTFATGHDDVIGKFVVVR